MEKWMKEEDLWLTTYIFLIMNLSATSFTVPHTSTLISRTVLVTDLKLMIRNGTPRYKV